jgi:hypothetical protein
VLIVVARDRSVAAHTERTEQNGDFIQNRTGDRCIALDRMKRQGDTIRAGKRG